MFGDTATVYRNEEDIDSALNDLLPKYNSKREDIFLTSKLDSQRVRQTIQNSLEGKLLKCLTDDPTLRITIWYTLIELKKECFLGSIGVSNYTVNHLKYLITNGNGVKLNVNQVDFETSCYCIFKYALYSLYCLVGSVSSSLRIRGSYRILCKARNYTKSSEF
ncbi:uncharacterized protein LOC131668501 [Phymastichus coffea]|uniref:uncharacterized protein LOC131668501 n=1 Tax=Phymastichus coffea TaxID=108790 RepID=UPI00273A834C|nr:uncharacterized protein LOC131668501 [Phymastichus coffea]